MLSDNNQIHFISEHNRWIAQDHIEWAWGLGQRKSWKQWEIYFGLHHICCVKSNTRKQNKLWTRHHFVLKNTKPSSERVMNVSITSPGLFWLLIDRSTHTNRRVIGLVNRRKKAISCSPLLYREGSGMIVLITHSRTTVATGNANFHCALVTYVIDYGHAIVIRRTS